MLWYDFSGGFFQIPTIQKLEQIKNAAPPKKPEPYQTGPYLVYSVLFDKRVTIYTSQMFGVLLHHIF